MNCSFFDKIWDYSNKKLPEDQSKLVLEHIESCARCNELHNNIKLWSNDRVTDNPYLASKILNKINPSERFYSKKSKLVTTYAYTFSLIIGVIIGISIITLNNKSNFNQLNQNALSYSDQITQYKADNYISELKSNETENILIEINQ